MHDFEFAKATEGMTAEEVLDYYRNLYHAEPQSTERGIIANALNDILPRMIVLPCKVGDTVYKVWYTECHNGETHPDSFGCCGCTDECDMHKAMVEVKVPNLDFIVRQFMGNNLNGVYFLTKEEAEQALKGGKHEF